MTRDEIIQKLKRDENAEYTLNSIVKVFTKSK